MPDWSAHGIGTTILRNRKLRNSWHRHRIDAGVTRLFLDSRRRVSSWQDSIVHVRFVYAKDAAAKCPDGQLFV